MSRSNPSVDLKNPATQVLEWAGASDAGYLKYYDKEAKEKKSIGLPFTFAYLDEMVSILGYSKQYKANIFSNEVRRTSSEDLKVMSFSNGKVITICEGIYSEIKDELKMAGGKYHDIAGNKSHPKANTE